MSDTAPPDTLSGDLREHIYRTYMDTSGPERHMSHWVMNLEWLNEVRRLDDPTGVLYHPGLSASGPQMLIGLPIEIRDDGGPPHLER
jgi:hypothetical protein